VAFAPDGKSILTGSDDSCGHLWPMPRMMRFDSEDILLWAETQTGFKLGVGDGLHELTAPEWRMHLAELKKRGMQLDS
jgi:hypothetical protein